MGAQGITPGIDILPQAFKGLGPDRSNIDDIAIWRDVIEAIVSTHFNKSQ